MKILLVNNSTSRWALAHFYSHAFDLLGHEARLLNIFHPSEVERGRRWRAKPRKLKIFAEKIQVKVFKIFKGVHWHGQSRILETLTEWKPDMVLIFGITAIDAETLQEIKKNVPESRIFLYSTDPLPFDNIKFIKSIPAYDGIFTFSKFQISQIHWFGGNNVFYLPFGYDARLHQKVFLTEGERIFYGSDVAYLGTWQPHIEFWLKELVSHDLKIWGNQWYRCKHTPKLMKFWQGEGTGLYDDFAKVVGASKAIFNVVRFQNGDGHSMKTFEIPACGGFMLANRTEEQLSFFEEDKSAVYFSTSMELKEKLEFYLKHPAHRERIAQEGYRMAQVNSYVERAKRILSFNERLSRCA